MPRSHHGAILFGNDNRVIVAIYSFPTILSSTLACCHVPCKLSKHRLRDKVVITPSFSVHVVLARDLISFVHSFSTAETVKGNFIIAFALAGRILIGRSACSVRRRWTAPSVPIEGGKGIGVGGSDVNPFARIPLQSRIGGEDLDGMVDA